MSCFTTLKSLRMSPFLPYIRSNKGRNGRSTGISTVHPRPTTVSPPPKHQLQSLPAPTSHHPNAVLAGGPQSTFSHITPKRIVRRQQVFPIPNLLQELLWCRGVSASCTHLPRTSVKQKTTRSGLPCHSRLEMMQLNTVP
jgi:hypothetical protein